MENEEFYEIFPEMKGIKMLENVIPLIPDEVLATPSSCSGKYHPKDEHGDMGVVRHTKRGLSFIKTCIAPLFKDDPERIERLYVAFVLHDVMKAEEYGFIAGKGRFTRNHAIAAKDLFKGVLPSEVLDMIERHGGNFYKNVPAPETMDEILMHVVDMAVTREHIFVDYKEELNTASVDVGALLGNKDFTNGDTKRRTVFHPSKQDKK